MRFYRARRIKTFNTQLTEALQQMANALRAGLTFQQAMDQIGRESSAPLRQEFGLFTKEVKLEVSNLSAEQKDPWGNMRRAAVATTTVNRKDFGLNWNKVLEAGGFLVGDEVTITLEIEMIPKKK